MQIESANALLTFTRDDDGRYCCDTYDSDCYRIVEFDTVCRAFIYNWKGEFVGRSRCYFTDLQAAVDWCGEYHDSDFRLETCESPE